MHSRYYQQPSVHAEQLGGTSVLQIIRSSLSISLWSEVLTSHLPLHSMLLLYQSLSNYLRTMARVSFTFVLFTLLSSCLITLVHSHTHLVWIVGLREGQTFEKHLGLVGRSIPVKEHRPEINGYTACVSDDDEDLLRAIRNDSSVGFVVNMPEDCFRKTEKFIEDGWDEDDRDLYEHMTHPDHHWHYLQNYDPEVLVTDEGGM